MARAELQVRLTKEWRPASTWPTPPLSVVQSTYREDRFSSKVVGQVRHDGPVTTIPQVRVTTLHWDAQGRLVGTGQTFLSGVAPGQTVSFEATVSPRGEGAVARTDTQVEAELIQELF